MFSGFLLGLGAGPLSRTPLFLARDNGFSGVETGSHSRCLCPHPPQAYIGSLDPMGLGDEKRGLREEVGADGVRRELLWPYRRPSKKRRDRSSLCVHALRKASPRTPPCDLGLAGCRVVSRDCMLVSRPPAPPQPRGLRCSRPNRHWCLWVLPDTVSFSFPLHQSLERWRGGIAGHTGRWAARLGSGWGWLRRRERGRKLAFWGGVE